MSEKLRWLERKITSNLHPRNEDFQHMLQDEPCRLTVFSFLNNENERKLFAYIRATGRQLAVSSEPPKPEDCRTKYIVFIKKSSGVTLTKDNIDDEVTYMDCSPNALEHLSILTRDIFIPLCCSEGARPQSVSTDRLVDVFHRLLAAIQTTEATEKGEVALSMPSAEVLSAASVGSSRQQGVLHILETTIVTWTKQIEKILRSDPIAELNTEYGPYPGPLDEVELWMSRRAKLASVRRQLSSSEATNLLQYLADATSPFVPPFRKLLKEIAKALEEAEENLTYLKTMFNFFETLNVCTEAQTIKRIFPSLIHTVFLVWTHSKYYHQPENFHNLLLILSNAVVDRARVILGEDLLSDPVKSYDKLKESLRICAAFRGVYIDCRERAQKHNEGRREEQQKILQFARSEKQGILFNTKLYGPNAFDPRHGPPPRKIQRGASESATSTELNPLQTDSPWPARNAKEFVRLNAFIERCNDLMELIKTIQHFQLLSLAADIGGSETLILDSLVRDVHAKYSHSLDRFLSRCPDLLATDVADKFVEEFFHFRTVVKEVEKKLADVIRNCFVQSSTTGEKLRILEVFQGIATRHLIQNMLKKEYQEFLENLLDEIQETFEMFSTGQLSPPTHANMPPAVCRVIWVQALQKRIQLPMNILQEASPQLLDCDIGRKLINKYTETIQALYRYETQLLTEWEKQITPGLADNLDQPLLISDNVVDEEEFVHPIDIRVNLDSKLVLLLREMTYLANEPYSLPLSAVAHDLITVTDKLTTTSKRLEMIVSLYHGVMKGVKPYELALFERTLAKIGQLFKLGLTEFTWRAEESADYVEAANALVCVDLHRNIDIVQTNGREIEVISCSWSEVNEHGVQLDVFSTRMTPAQSYTLEQLNHMQQSLNESFESIVVPSGSRIHRLLRESFDAADISEASPSWQDYILVMDGLVLEGLKRCTLNSLLSLYRQLTDSELNVVPMLTVRIELIRGQVVFTPPLDRSSISMSLQECVEMWLASYMDRGSFVQSFVNKECSHRDTIVTQDDVQYLIKEIMRLVEENAVQCQELLLLFTGNADLWEKHMKQELQSFLHRPLTADCGSISSSSMASSSGSHLDRADSMTPSLMNSRASSAQTYRLSVRQLVESERNFLSLPKTSDDQCLDSGPTLDDFDNKLNSFKAIQESTESLPPYRDMGWLRVDLEPMKCLVSSYAQLWTWTFTHYLEERVLSLLNYMETFLTTMQPHVDVINDNDTDTASLKKTMRTLHEVSAVQNDLDGRLVAMTRTVELLHLYKHKMSDKTSALIESMTSRWSLLKLRVAQVKQKVGPKVAQQSGHVAVDLTEFVQRISDLYKSMRDSLMYNRRCAVTDALAQIDQFEEKLEVLSRDGQDFLELQAYLDNKVADFGLLHQCSLENAELRRVWQKVVRFHEQEQEWRKLRWHKLSTVELTEVTGNYLAEIGELDPVTADWDVTIGLVESLKQIRAYLPIMDDLSNTAMRARHWKLLAQAIGGTMMMDSDALKMMTFGELLKLGLEKHVTDVHSIVQRATADLTVERILKTYEEIWMSKTFELKEHQGYKSFVAQDSDAASTDHDQLMDKSVLKQPDKHKSAGSNRSSRLTQRQMSTLSLPKWLQSVEEDAVGRPVYVLSNVDAIFDELENHQMSLQSLHSNDVAVSSFMEDVQYWQNILRDLESVLQVWAATQERWIELEEIYMSNELAASCQEETRVFVEVDRDFRLLMKTVEKNNNVFQCCQREKMLSLLEGMALSLELCWKAAYCLVEIKRQIFPRFYFLTDREVLFFICKGHNLHKNEPYVRRCFKNIDRLVLSKSEPNIFSIEGVSSHLSELKLSEAVSCDGAAELWLSHLSRAIAQALSSQLAAAMPLSAEGQLNNIEPVKEEKGEVSNGEVITEEGNEAEKIVRDMEGENENEKKIAVDLNWNLLNVPEQADNILVEIAYLRSQIHNTSLTVQLLNDMNNGSKDTMQIAIDKIDQRLTKLIASLAHEPKLSKKTGSEIRKLVETITLTRHLKALLNSLLKTYISTGVSPIKDPAWCCQLQYFYNSDTGSVQINCLKSTFSYGFEYLGSTIREPMTLDSDRLFFTLSQALNMTTPLLLKTTMGQAANLILLRELSHCFGRALFTFDCSPASNSRVLQTVLKGLAAAGVWVCLRNIDRLPSDVAGVFAERLRAVMTALRGRSSTIDSIGSNELCVDPNGAFFASIGSATVGLSYAGDILHSPMLLKTGIVSLPRELLLQFRAVNVMTPSLQPLVEMILHSLRFLGAREIAEKLTELLSLCSEIFCEQLRCYFSSVRTIKSIICHAAVILFESEGVNYINETNVHEQTLMMERRAVATALNEAVVHRLTDSQYILFQLLLKNLSWLDVRLDHPSSRDGSAASQVSTRLDPRFGTDVTFKDDCSERTSDEDPIDSWTGERCFSHYLVKQAEELLNKIDPVNIAARKLGLIPSAEFMNRVNQLRQFCIVNETVLVTGPARCGKTSCIKMFANTPTTSSNNIKQSITMETIFPNSYETKDLLGYCDKSSRLWVDGILCSTLNKFGNSSNKSSTDLNILHLDGSLIHCTLLDSFLRNSQDNAFLFNGEQTSLPPSVHVLIETSSIADVSPSFLTNAGLLPMSSNDDGWRLVLLSWLTSRSEREHLEALCHKYVPATLRYLRELRDDGSGCGGNTGGDIGANPTALRIKCEKLRESNVREDKMIWPSDEMCIYSLTVLLQASLQSSLDVDVGRLEKIFNYCCVWSFGGMLRNTTREEFSNWWLDTFGVAAGYPNNCSVFDYFVDTVSDKFVSCSENVSSGCIPADTLSPGFIRTTSNEALLRQLKLLSDGEGHCSVMIVGSDSYSKSSLLRQYVKTRQGGSEQGKDPTLPHNSLLSLQGNRFMTSKLLLKRIEEKMEWKYGSTYLPRNSKSLLCVIDDLHLSLVNKEGMQTALEIIREHASSGGMFSPSDKKWREMLSVKYLASIDENSLTDYPEINRRLVGHFVMLAVPAAREEELHFHFNSMLKQHFSTSAGASCEQSNISDVAAGVAENSNVTDRLEEKASRERQQKARNLFLSSLVQVTLEIHRKVSRMYLRTADRSHYYFSCRDLNTLFRNLCLSLEPSCSRESMLLLWDHECSCIYGGRMINEIDSGRFRQMFVRAIHKNYDNAADIRLLTGKDKPIFSSLRETSSSDSLKAAGQDEIKQNPSDKLKLKTDGYHPVYHVGQLRSILAHEICEYNKNHPAIKLALHRTVIEQVCRLARVFGSPHDLAQTMVVADGCVGRVTAIVHLAAHLAGYSVFRSMRPTSPRTTTDNIEDSLRCFRSDITTAFKRAGIEGSKLLFLLEEDDMEESDFLVYLTEFLITGSVSHLFTTNEQTTIVNTLRADVMRAGLSYSREVAWSYFLNIIKTNVRICFVASSGGIDFQRRCREYVTFTQNINITWFPHWTKKQLINCTAFKIRECSWMTGVEVENISHLLATMHLVIKQQDRQKNSTSLHKHLTNHTFEKFIERFIVLANMRHSDIHVVHDEMVKLMNKIAQEDRLKTKFKKDYEHESVVLEEKKIGTTNMLAQIGQDTGIAEQRAKLVMAQMKRLKELQTLLPEYRLAHERAVYKAVAIVSDTKKIVKEINLEGLGELRAMQKPPTEVEQLLAAVIMILKSAQSDLTWQKGAKRQMSNLERFIEELMSFDEMGLPESTLTTIEAYLAKPESTADNLLSVTGNSACASLGSWMKGVCRYQRILASKVKPLHARVNETVQDIETVEHKMSTIETEKKALENRIGDLMKSYESATVDKMKQLEKVEKMRKTLDSAGRINEVLAAELGKIQRIVDSLSSRSVWLPGSVALAAGFVSYLGPYDDQFRHELLTIHWPRCLAERGLPLAFDKIDPIQGHVMEFSMGDLTGHVNFGDVDSQNVADKSQLTEILPEEVVLSGGSQSHRTNHTTDTVRESSVIDAQRNDQQPAADSIDALDDLGNEEDAEEGEDVVNSEVDNIEEETVCSQTDSQYSQPILTRRQYEQYIRCLLKLLVGQTTVLDWIKNDHSLSRMENSAIVLASSDLVPMILDVHGEGRESFLSITKQMTNQDPVVIDMNMCRKPNADLMSILNDKIKSGGLVFLLNCGDEEARVLKPLIELSNSRWPPISTEIQESKLIEFNGRRVLCHPNFKLFLSSTIDSPQRLSVVLSSNVTLINWTACNQRLFDNLLKRVFPLLQPRSYREHRSLLARIYENYALLEALKSDFNSKLSLSDIGGSDEKQLFSEADVEHFALLSSDMQQVQKHLTDMSRMDLTLCDVHNKCAQLATRATALYAAMHAMAAIHREYQFGLPYLFELFDEAVSGSRNVAALPPEYSDICHHSRVGTDGRMAGSAKVIAPPVLLLPSSTAENMVSEDELPASDMNREHTPSDVTDDARLSDDELTTLTNRLTTFICHRVQQSLYSKHRLLFATLCCINILEETKEFTDEEMEVFIRGHGNLDWEKTLQNTGYIDPRSLKGPSWIPTLKWQNFLSVSLPDGLLSDIHTEIKKEDSLWQSWYESTKPELEPTPKTISVTLNLLLLRILRPDRFHVGAANFFMSHLTSGDICNVTKQFADDKVGYLNLNEHPAVLVLLPPSSSNNSVADTLCTTILSHSVLEHIREIAKKHRANVETVYLGEGNDDLVSTVVTKTLAASEPTWLVLQNLHLASQKCCSDIYHQLQLLQNVNKDGHRKVSLWFTTEPSDHSSLTLLRCLTPLCWDSLVKMAAESNDRQFNNLVYTSQNIIITGILRGFDLIAKEMWLKLFRVPLVAKRLFFASTVIFGMLSVRETTSRHFFPLENESSFMHTIDSVCSNLDDVVDGDLGWLTCTRMLFEDMFMSMLLVKSDRTIILKILRSAEQDDPDLEFGSLRVPFPPADIEPSEYCVWLQEKLSTLGNLEDLSVLGNVDQSLNEFIGDEFVNNLECIYSAQSTSVIESCGKSSKLDMLHLRSILDHLDRCLPDYLNTDTKHSTTELKLEGSDKSPPSARRRPLSTETRTTPAILSHVLLEECILFNSLLYHVRKDISDIHECLLCGEELMPTRLREISMCLKDEQVPADWIYAECWPRNSQTLGSWQQDLARRCEQMQAFMGMSESSLAAPPVYAPSRAMSSVKSTPRSVFSAQSTPRSVGSDTETHKMSFWLGGFLNPRAIIAALRYQKSIDSKSLLKQVKLQCDNLNSSKMADLTNRAIITNLVLEGTAAWRIENSRLCFHPNSDDTSFTIAPLSLLTSISGNESHSTMATSTDADSMFTCPVYETASHRVHVADFQVPISNSDAASGWTLLGAAVIINQGHGTENQSSRTFTVLRSFRRLQRPQFGKTAIGSDIGELSEEMHLHLSKLDINRQSRPDDDNSNSSQLLTPRGSQPSAQRLETKLDDLLSAPSNQLNDSRTPTDTEIRNSVSEVTVLKKDKAESNVDQQGIGISPVTDDIGEPSESGDIRPPLESGAIGPQSESEDISKLSGSGGKPSESDNIGVNSVVAEEDLVNDNQSDSGSELPSEDIVSNNTEHGE